MQGGHESRRALVTVGDGCLSREVPGNRVRQGIVRVHDVQALGAVHIQDRTDQSQIVRRGCEQGIGQALRDVHLHGPAGARQARRHVIAEQVHGVPALRQGQRQLAGEHT